MRKLIVILLLTCSVAQGQYVKGRLTSGTGYPNTYGNANSILMSYGLHIPPHNPNDPLPGMIIFMHGVDHRGPAGDTTTAAGIDKVSGKGVPLMIKYNPLPPFVKPGTSTMYKWAVLFPQCSSAFSLWPVAYLSEMIKLAKNSYANQVDTNKIIVIGFSLGGCGGLIGAEYPFINENVAAMYLIAPGCWGVNQTQYVAKSGLPIKVYICQNDPLAPVSNPDGVIKAMNVFDPVWPIGYARFSGATAGSSGHDIWPIILDTIPGDQYAQTNGDMWVNDPTIFVDGLRYDKQRKKRP